MTTRNRYTHRRPEKHKFNSFYNNPSPWNIVTPAAGGVAENQSNSSEFVKYLIGNSNFHEMGREELLENIYIIDPEVASAVDSFSVMCREAFRYFKVIDDVETDNLPANINSIDNTNPLDELASYSIKNPLIQEMIDTANWIARTSHVEDLIEQFSAILFIHGNLYIRDNDDNTMTVLPNDRVTIVDDKSKAGQSQIGENVFENMITDANWLILDEDKSSMDIYNSTKFRVVRFREVPINVRDCKGRLTYGIYSLSPLRRTVIPIWYKRLIMANDALWRAKNVPREHHQISAEPFNTGLFTGSNEVRMRKAQAMAENFIEQYKQEVSSKSPDQAYITLDTIKIDNIEPSSAGYMEANQLLNQMDDAIYSAVNLPRSVVKGVSSSNYASELVISKYTSTKVVQITKKIGNLILETIKGKLLQINPRYPVQYLDTHVIYDLGTSYKDKVQIVQILGTMGLCTRDELRNMIELKPLTKEQLAEGTVNTSQKADTSNQSNMTKYPTTPESASQQPTNSAQAIVNKVTQSTSQSVKTKNRK